MTPKEQAYQAGQWAAESGRPISSRPMFGPTPECAELRKAWVRGWNETMKKRDKR